MTRAERIEAAAMKVVKFPDEIDMEDIDALIDALALPPDPQPRRLTVEDFNEAMRRIWLDKQIVVDALNARIWKPEP